MYRQIAKYQSLRVDVQSTDAQVKKIYDEMFANNKRTAHYDLFRPYLRHFYDYEITDDEIAQIQAELKNIYYEIRHYLLQKDDDMTALVQATLQRKTPICTHNKDYGVTVKLFKIRDQLNRERMLKTFIFSKSRPEDFTSMTEEFHDAMHTNMIKQNFIDEIAFQEYAASVQKRTFDFIVPRIYYYGVCDYYDRMRGNRAYVCYYILMEYVEGISMRDAFMSRGCENMYIKTAMQNADRAMRTNLLHHNDLHGDNVIVTKDNRIAIIDFGSAACGPTTMISSL